VTVTVAPDTKGVPTVIVLPVPTALLAYVRSNLFYFNFFSSSNLVLFATGFYDRVHVRPRKLSSADGFPQSPIF
jgi:hypothetical protein